MRPGRSRPTLLSAALTCHTLLSHSPVILCCHTLLPHSPVTLYSHALLSRSALTLCSHTLLSRSAATPRCFAIGFASLLLHESATGWQLAGGALVVLSNLLASVI